MDNIIFEFKGTISRCVYKSNDFSVYGVDIDKKKYSNIELNKYGNVSIHGELPELSIGVEYCIKCEKTINKYGTSYKVLNIRRDKLTTIEDTKIFLTEILTEKQADTLLNVYPDIINIVKNEEFYKVDLSKLNGIKEYTWERIKDKIISNFCLMDIITEFKGLLSLSMVKKIYDKYSSIDILRKKLKENPYTPLTVVSGVGFKTADSIILEIEKENIIDFGYDVKTSKDRCLACLLYLLEENEKNGHTKMSLTELRKKCLALVPKCAEHFTTVIKTDSIYYNKETLDISLRKTYDIEYRIAKVLLHNLRKKNKDIWDFDIEKYRNVGGIDISDEQIQSLDNICKYRISILNGSAGTGKSFSTQAAINMFKDNRKTFKLFSPTGKAAKVLSDYTKERAMTIHRGLGYNPSCDYPWTINKENKLKCDVVIVDEFSMVDIFLFDKLLDAMDFNTTRLVIIGDNAQLCSVGCGNLLHDFMETKLIPTVTLSKVFRYGEGGLMKVATDVRFCKKYLSKNMKNTMTKFGANKDYMFVDLSSEAIPQNVVGLYKKLLSKGYGIEDIQVLTAKNVGDCGTVTLNNMIQKVANPNYGSKVFLKSGDTVFFEGDLIIQKVNNYKAEMDIESMDEWEREFYSNKKNKPTAFIANGETGIIKQIYHNYMIIDFDGIKVKYDRDDIKKIKLGYSITIHAAQGSSIKIVILCTPQSHIFMLNSNLLYVGLTRMKEVCYHLGTLTSVNQAVGKKANLTRHTFMQYLLTTMPEEEYNAPESEKKIEEFGTETE